MLCLSLFILALVALPLAPKKAPKVRKLPPVDTKKHARQMKQRIFPDLQMDSNVSMPESSPGGKSSY